MALSTRQSPLVLALLEESEGRYEARTQHAQRPVPREPKEARIAGYLDSLKAGFRELPHQPGHRGKAPPVDVRPRRKPLRQPERTNTIRVHRADEQRSLMPEHPPSFRKRGRPVE